MTSIQDDTDSATQMEDVTPSQMPQPKNDDDTDPLLDQVKCSMYP